MLPKCEAVKLDLTLHTLLGLSLLLTTTIMSQTTTGSIVGTVTDPNGAAVVQAPVTVVNMGSSTGYKLSTDGAGTYVATSLPVGKYSVAVQSAGFKRAVSSNIVVNVQDRVRLDFHLKLGDTTQSVEVADSAPLLQTDNSYLSQVVGSKPISDLPLNGRYFQRLAWLTASSIPGPSATQDGQTGTLSPACGPP